MISRFHFLGAVIPVTFLLLLAGVARPASAQEPPEPVTVTEVRVEITADGKDATRLESLARSLIVVSPGDPLAPDGLQRSIERLKRSGRFSAIHVDAPKTPGGVAVAFSLTPVNRIKDIKIEHAFPLLERELLNVMTVYTGDAYNPDEVKDQEPAVIELYKREGYIDPKVTVTPKQDPEDGHYVLTVDINKGPHYEVSSLDIEGNTAFSDLRLKARLDTWPASFLPGVAGRYVASEVKADVKNLTAFYREAGYADVEISWTAPTETRLVPVTLTIVEGDRYEIEFAGNEEFTGWWTLSRDLTLFETGNRNGAGLRKSVKAIRERYRAAGYREATVEAVDLESPEGVRRIRIEIHEGPQTTVSAVRIQGNQAFDDERIRKQMVTRPPSWLHDGAFSKSELAADVDAVTAFYFKEGYRETVVETDLDRGEDPTRVAVTVRIEEGPQTLVRSVSIEGDLPIDESTAREALSLTPGAPFREYMVTSDENALAAAVSEAGYPHVKVDGESSITDDGTGATLTYTVSPGPSVTMGEVFVSGNFKTRNRVVLRELEVLPGSPFSPRRLLETERNIRDLDIFDSVRFKALGLEDQSDTVQLLVSVEEAKPYSISIGGGYDTERGLFAHARGENRNFRGLDMDTWIAGEVSEIGYGAETGLREPRLLGSKISAAVGAFAEERDEQNQAFSTRTLGGYVSFDRPLWDHFHAGVEFRGARREQRRDDPDDETYTDAELEPRTLLTASPSLTYDSRDSVFNPKKGIFSTAAVDINRGLDNDLDNFVKYRFDLRGYVTPISRLTFALRGQVGSIEPYDGADKVPDDQLFYLGGTADVRGFDENLLRTAADRTPLGGQQSALGSVEARIDIGMNLELALFYDLGRLTDSYGDEGSDDFRSTAGAGLRYITPIGPIGFLYGHKLDREADESAGRWHLSFGYTF